MIYVLTVLKVIGIILLVIVALVVLLLVVPVSYSVDVDLSQRHASVRIGWLLRLIRFRFLYEDEMAAIFSVLFFHIDFLDEKRREKRKARKSRRDEKKKRKSGAEERSLMQRVLGVGKTLWRVLVQAREHQVLSEAWPSVRLFLYRVRPRQLCGQVEFGMRDPSTTGRITGAIAALPFIYQTDLAVTPDFEAEESYINGEIYAQGHVFLLHVLMMLIGLIRSRQIRAFLGALRKKN